MSGGGTPRTGVGIVDNAVDYVDHNVIAPVSNGVNNAGSQFGNFLNNQQNVIAPVTALNSYLNGSKNIANDVQNMGSRLEKVGQRTVQSWAALASGKWNNLGRTLLDGSGVLGPTNMMTFAGASDEDVSKTFGETLQERGAKEAIGQAEAAAKEDAAATERNVMQGVADTISGIIGARKNYPGRDQILLSKGKKNQSGPTLLSLKGA
jgi:hypothetical protein